MYSTYQSKVLRALCQAGLSQLTLILALSGALFTSLRAQAIGANITVNTTTDLRGDGKCSFQEAIQAANTNAAVDACQGGNPTPSDVDTIGFNISGSGIHTITVTTVTQIIGPVMIDGSLQPGYSGIPLIEITGTVEDLLRFSEYADNSTLKALMLTNKNSGGLVDGSTALFYSKNNRIIRNYFNTDGSSSVAPHGAGLLFDISSTGNVIGGTITADRNLFGGQVGIYLQDSSSNLIQGNFFGVQANGITTLSGLPRNGSAIQIFNYAGNATNNTVRGNVITGFLAGVNLSQGANSNTIVGNYIGVGADGSTPLSNGIGVLVYGAANNTIGGTTAAARNVISGNSSTNITLQTLNASHQTINNVIQGNYIGPDASGLGIVSPGALYGIYVVGGAANNRISGNVIAGNFDGVYIDVSAAVGSGSSQNCFNGNTRYGVYNTNSGTIAPLGGNWWGSLTGPTYSGNPGGTGDAISAFVNYSPFLTSAAASCMGRLHPIHQDMNGDGKDDLAGLTGAGTIFYTTNLSSWTNVPGQLSRLVAADLDGNGAADLAGLTGAGTIFYTTNLSYWVNVPGQLSRLVAADLDGNGAADLAGLTGAGTIFYTTNLSYWVNVPGGLSQLVAADLDGDGKDDLAGIGGYGHIYYTTDLRTWTNIPGGLSQMVAGDFNGDGKDDLAGIGGYGHIYYTTDLRTWTNIPGQLAVLGGK